MEYIKLYFKSKIRLMFVFIICCVIFGVVFYLTDLPLKAVLYPALLCMIVFAAAASLNIRRTIIRHSEMKSFLTDPSDLCESMLPESHSVEDEDKVGTLDVVRRSKLRCADSAYDSLSLEKIYRIFRPCVVSEVGKGLGHRGSCGSCGSCRACVACVAGVTGVAAYRGENHSSSASAATAAGTAS